jgi:aryl-alcohol dehydrogenase-like predicted oxidoreductase
LPTRQQPSNAARRAGCRHQLLRLLALLRWRPGRAAPRHRVEGQRDDVIVGTKAGRYRFDEFDFSPRRIRDGLHRSLELLKTDYVDILQLHDIEFVFLDGVFADAYGKLVRLRDEGKCRFIGMTGYPLHTIRRAITETDLDVVLNYAHFTLLNTVAHRPLVADPRPTVPP